MESCTYGKEGGRRVEENEEGYETERERKFKVGYGICTYMRARE